MPVTVLHKIICTNIQVILRTDKTVNNFSDRSILKNLGRWLGMQTLAKNKPVLHEVCNTLQAITVHLKWMLCRILRLRILS